MKKNLGKIITIIILLNAVVFAQDLASYKLSINKKDPYINEAVEINLEVKQTNHKDMMYFFFEPKKSEFYKIKLLTKTIKELSHHNSTATFKYILFPLKENNNTLIDFDFTIKTASDQAVTQAYVADHDQSKAIEMQSTNIKIKPLHINIRTLKENVDLVGDFTLETDIDTQNINQYQSVNLHYTLQGIGNTNHDLKLIKKSKDFTLFVAIDENYKKLTSQGYKIKKTYTYSLSAKDNFTIPAINLYAYSPTKNEYYNLTSRLHNIKVTKIDAATLVDDEEYPLSSFIVNFTKIKEFIIYIFIFMFGYLVAKITQNGFKLKGKNTKYQDIKRSKTSQELILILLKSYSNKNIDKFIKQLEELQYSKGDKSLAEIKTSILKHLG